MTSFSDRPSIASTHEQYSVIIRLNTNQNNIWTPKASDNLLVEKPGSHSSRGESRGCRLAAVHVILQVSLVAPRSVTELSNRVAPHFPLFCRRKASFQNQLSNGASRISWRSATAVPVSLKVKTLENLQIHVSNLWILFLEKSKMIEFSREYVLHGERHSCRNSLRMPA